MSVAVASMAMATSAMAMATSASHNNSGIAGWIGHIPLEEVLTNTPWIGTCARTVALIMILLLVTWVFRRIYLRFKLAMIHYKICVLQFNTLYNKEMNEKRVREYKIKENNRIVSERIERLKGEFKNFRKNFK